MKTIKNKIAIMIFLSISILSACKKEEAVTPISPSTPTAPTIPVIPAVSMKPIHVFTTENGATIKSQNFNYNTQGVLVKYDVKSSTGIDSVIINSNSVAFKKNTSNNVVASLTLNTDKTFKSLFQGNDQFFFEHNNTQLLSLFKIIPNNASQQTAQFNYTNNTLTTIFAEIRIDINYHNNLPYQKGINELPVALKPIQFYKAIELSNISTSVLYNKFQNNFQF